MAEVKTYSEWMNGIKDNSEKVIIDMANDSTNQNINKTLEDLYRVPSHIYSMMIPKLKFYRLGNQFNPITLFYRPREFPNGVTYQHQDRGNVAGIKSFNLISNEIMGFLKQTRFDFTFDISDSKMFRSGHKDNNDVMEFFKINKSEPLVIEYGWNKTGVPDVDNVIAKLGSSYPVVVNTSNWHLQVTSDRITTCKVEGWTGLNKSDMSRIFVCCQYVPKLIDLLDKRDKYEKDIEKNTRLGKKDKNSADILSKNLLLVKKDLKKEFVRAYKQFHDRLKNYGDQIKFIDLLKEISKDFEFFERSSGIKVTIVSGDYNKSKQGFMKFKSLGDVMIPVDKIFKDYLYINEKSEDSRMMLFEAFIQNIVRDYMSNEEYILNTDKDTFNANIGEYESNRGVTPSIRINYIPYNNKLYILIDDINRYYSALRVKNSLSMKIDEKIRLAQDANIPIINLEKMNTLYTYPIDITTNVDESLQSVFVLREAERNKKENQGETSNTKKLDINVPFKLLPINAPFGMMGNFLLRPFQCVFITWGSETFDRFYIINKMTHGINENGQFMANYETVHTQY